MQPMQGTAVTSPGWRGSCGERQDAVEVGRQGPDSHAVEAGSGR